MENLLSETEFWTGISILINNYHAIDKKIFACVINEIQSVYKGIEKLQTIEECHPSEISALQDKKEVVCGTCTKQELQSATVDRKSDFEGFIIYYKILPKKLTEDFVAVGIIDLSNKTYMCRFQCPGSEDFSVKLVGQCLDLQVLKNHRDLKESKRWLNYVLRPKLLRWCKSHETSSSLDVKQTSSLQLVDLEIYNTLYKELKQKYAVKALRFWSDAKESTNALKFIYEDFAIAAYLICLWQRKGAPNAFADLGCGNGLLVYILTEEGFKGYGYDVRARKLWSFYPPSTQLIEKTIDPHNFELPAEIDWLIGNHSDELSPWLPVLAAIGSYNMRYFVLPCCSFELSGAKFQRRNTGKSTYQDFYSYLQSISKVCGYETQLDRLKIPSTKRLALIGVERIYPQSDFMQHVEAIKTFVLTEQDKYANNVSKVEVKLRPKEESVRNCTRINRHIIDELVLKIFNLLLTSVHDKNNTENISKVWKKGGRLRMCDIAKYLNSSDLKQIKSECGGIKTLLRNHREIFEFCVDDLVGIRKPEKRTIRKLQTVKKRACFFQLNHPDGCPLSAEDCSFVH